MSRNRTLNFPNRSRSFDGSRNRVRFWGYDSALEISFFVEADALRRLVPDMSDAEVGLLVAFDTARDRIQEVAEEVYTSDRKGAYSYVLAAEDF